MNKILIIRFSSLGDILLTTPLVRALKNRLQHCEIEYFTKAEFAPLLEGNPYISKLHILEGKDFAALSGKVAELKRHPYDLLIDLHRNPRSWYTRNKLLAEKKVKMKRDRFRRWLLVHLGVNYYRGFISVAVRYFSALNGLFDPPIMPDEKGLDLFLNDEDRAEARKFIGNKPGKLIAIAPSAHWNTKRWLPEKFAETADALAKKYNAQTVVLGAPEDENLAVEVCSMMRTPALNLAGKLSIRGTSAVMELCFLFIGNDTGLMHIASALKLPGAAIFGPTTRHLGYFPYRSRLTVVEKEGLSCRPCTKQGNKKCPKGHFRCMKEISVEEVVNAAAKSLEETP